MGETKSSFRRASYLTIIVSVVLAVAAYLLTPYANPWASLVVLVAGIVVLTAIFVRFHW
jgi:hypothetical protein